MFQPAQQYQTKRFCECQSQNINFIENLTRALLKATSNSTILDIPMRPVREDLQRFAR